MKRIKRQTVVHSSDEIPNGKEKLTNGHMAVTVHFSSRVIVRL
ncbi:hypothetical protein ACFSTA_20735 [Ornithinibacillus salinisoli]|uniref:Uncharacterized protein n=1 Tax=Ornithinibacillus salinisoli TaxID=1848459 RepID=A0ABW4W4M9_9BACI